MPSPRPTIERRKENIGEIEIRFVGGEADDVVMPWPRRRIEAITHIERLDSRCIWVGLTDRDGNEVHFHITSEAKVAVAHYVNREVTSA
jgi:hypothetical protein